MDSDEAPGPQAMRLRVTLELSRSDDPLLFDALVQLKKGRRRVARLRTLAHDGLLAAIPQPSAAQAQGPAKSVPVDIEHGGERTDLAALDPRVTAGLFDVPLEE
ncbi:hypothetical protein DelCs14_1836 [Delftia sp. Cs1-4]|nr:hypothetical protein DelCs14_1836 [Delftia sp. Cs1-4]